MLYDYSNCLDHVIQRKAKTVYRPRECDVRDPVARSNSNRGTDADGICGSADMAKYEDQAFTAHVRQ